MKEETENPFIEKDGEKLDRKELEKFSNNELAQMVFDKALTPYQFSTLKSYSKKRLIDLLLGIEKPEQTTARAPQTKSESQAITNDILSTFEEAKKIRSDEEAKNNSLVSRVFRTNAEKMIDKALADEKFSSSSFNKTLTIVSFIALFIDTVVGFENIPKHISKAKEKLQEKRDQKLAAQTANQQQAQYQRA